MIIYNTSSANQNYNSIPEFKSSVQHTSRNILKKDVVLNTSKRKKLSKNNKAFLKSIGLKVKN